ncbi:unnamed protein product [Durusdinium trenchii]|uniref:protein-serine/threonine phosphatase n=1 Tax=Durusdinium trenchii TaxID=1381693 RepID=A0ABP0IYP7_9DINO
MQTAFDQLPLACVVGGHILCVHGGVGDGRWDLNDLRAVRRPLGQQELGSSKFRWVHNILWSDPIEDDRAQRDAERDALHVCILCCAECLYPWPNLTRFGWDVTKTFCARNGVDMVVRSHQSKKNGLGFDLMHDECLIRVFSARDYEGHCNDGAVLLVRSGEDEGLQGRPSLSVRAQVVGSYGKAVQRSQAKSKGPETGGAHLWQG